MSDHIKLNYSIRVESVPGVLDLLETWTSTLHFLEKRNGEEITWTIRTKDGLDRELRRLVSFHGVDPEDATAIYHKHEAQFVPNFDEIKARVIPGFIPGFTNFIPDSQGYVHRVDTTGQHRYIVTPHGAMSPYFSTFEEGLNIMQGWMERRHNPMPAAAMIRIAMGLLASGSGLRLETNPPRDTRFKLGDFQAVSSG